MLVFSINKEIKYKSYKSGLTHFAINLYKKENLEFVKREALCKENIENEKFIDNDSKVDCKSCINIKRKLNL